MEKKEHILLSKLNIKDYTKHLEKILEKKKFSLDTKNLLLSMLYKIENGYSDYAKAKVEVPTKAEFIENILQIIQTDCKEIIVANFNSEASRVLEEKQVQYIIDEKQKKIICYGNDLLLLNCILGMSEKEISIPPEKQDLQPAICYFLNLGNKMNQVEVIRDFNGWSWDTAVKEIQSVEVNLIFQTLLYLEGYEFVSQWIKNESVLADYISLLQDDLKSNYGEERANSFIFLFCEITIDLLFSQSMQQKEFWKAKREKYRAELAELEDKQKYLEEKTKQKKEYTKQIEEIDKIVNNKELLKEEYNSRNDELPNKEKIFSISHLTDRLEKEREDLLEKIKNSNHLIDPKGYVARKQEVEDKVNFLNTLDLEEKQDMRELLIRLCQIYLECFQIKVVKSQTKNEVISYLYQLRYIRFLPFDKEGTTLRELPKLIETFSRISHLLLEKAKKLDIIEEVTEDEKANEEILSKIFDSKMIDLDHMVIQTKVEDGKLFVEYYDENVLENTVQIQSDRTIRLKRKTKLFV